MCMPTPGEPTPGGLLTASQENISSACVLMPSLCLFPTHSNPIEVKNSSIGSIDLKRNCSNRNWACKGLCPYREALKVSHVSVSGKWLVRFTSLSPPSVTLAASPGGHRSWHTDKPSANRLTNYWFSPHFEADNNKLWNALHPSISPSGAIPVCNIGSTGAFPSLRPWQADGALRLLYFVLLPSSKCWQGEVFAQSLPFIFTPRDSEHMCMRRIEFGMQKVSDTKWG